MLRLFAPDFPAPPPGKDLLEWAQEKVEDGTVNIVQRRKVNTIRTQRKGRLPSLSRMAANLAGTIVDVAKGAIKGKRVICCEEQVADRKAVCDACEHQEIIKGHERCVSFPGSAGCGCRLKSKRKLAAATCKVPVDTEKPDGPKMWDAVDNEYEVTTDGGPPVDRKD